MPEMIIMRAPSGAGKSTLASQLGVGGVVLSTDNFWITTDGKYEFDASRLQEAHSWNLARAKEAVLIGISPIVIDNTNTTFNEMFPYVRLAKINGYSIRFVEPDWHPQLKVNGKWNYPLIIDLQSERSKSNSTKNIPASTIARMIARYEYRLNGENDHQLADRILANG